MLSVMPLISLQAQWYVQAGVIPGTPEPEHTKVWNYSSADYAADAAQIKAESEDPTLVNMANPPKTKYMTMMEAAHDYARSITDPNRLNWVTVGFLWL